ncbi:small-subunit processome [Auricularia subglabra TFB-10046 SS5]|nr:small-subunit processome [Auricularia subglabra TFB-10046 SS5]
MGGSSLRNSLHRRNHKERGQLAHRTRLGILEKHKDYVQRARDYHSKKDRLKRLQEKAATKNDDEFYFGMVKQRTKGGVHIQDRGNQVLPVDMVKILKTQDGNYLRTTRATNAKKIDALKLELGSIAELAALGREDDWVEDVLSGAEQHVLQEAGLLPVPSSSKKRKRADPKHLVFADSLEQGAAIARKMDVPAPVESSTTSQPSAEQSTDLGWVTPAKKKKRASAVEAVESKTSKSKSKSQSGDDDEDELEGYEKSADPKARLHLHCALHLLNLPQKRRTQLLKELAARLQRDRSLKYAERELEMQRLLMGKGAAKKLADREKANAEDDDEDADLVIPGKRMGKKKKSQPVDEETWKPRVYKWKFDRKR